MTGTTRVLDPEDIEEVHRLRLAAFGPGDEQAFRAVYPAVLARGEVLGWYEGAELVACARLSVVEHWFGGRRVPCQHVASVAVPPEHRGRGVASVLMRTVIERGAEAGLGLSLLYPAVQGLYRRLGWEVAGTLREYRLDARLAPSAGPALRVLDPEKDRAAVEACHAAAGRLTHGPAVRPATRWDELWDDVTHAYGLDAGDAEAGLDAYALVSHERDPGDWQYRLEVIEMGALTARGLAGLLAFIGRHGSLAKEATFYGPVPHPFVFATVEQDVRPAGGMHWMARGLDLPTFAAARGFPAGLALQVSLAVDDDVLPTARGPWRLTVADGRGQLDRAEGADVRLAARAVGPLVTGFTSPAQLALAGLLQGPADALDLLAAAFASPHPVLTEFF